MSIFNKVKVLGFLLCGFSSLSVFADLPQYTQCGITYGKDIIKVNGSPFIEAIEADDFFDPSQAKEISFGPSNRYGVKFYRYTQTETHSQMNIEWTDKVSHVKNSFVFYMESNQVNQKSSFVSELPDQTKIVFFCSIKNR